MSLLNLAARHGDWVLVMGLVAGILLPGPARILQPWLPQMVVVLLFLSVLRTNPKDLLGALADLPRILVLVIILQLLLPMSVLGIAAVGGWLDHPVTLALAMMSAAPSIVGSANICIIMGFPPRAAVRLMVAGSVLLPVTVLPVFLLLPDLGEVHTVLTAAARLIGVIALGASSAIILRLTIMANPSHALTTRLNGLSALALAVFVIALMPALTEIAFAQPLQAVMWLSVATAANIGLQLVAHRIASKRYNAEEAVSIGIIAGNRNIALFLASLPSEVTAPILAFIACYQIPMYLTPMLMKRVYRKA